MLDLNLKKFLIRCGVKDIDNVASVHAFGVEYDYMDKDVNLKVIHRKIWNFYDLKPHYEYYYKGFDKIVIIFKDGGTLVLDFFPHKWERILVDL